MRACLAALFILAFPTVAAAEDFSYRVAQQDTLIGVAGRLLREPADWPKLQKLNRIRDPYRLQPGSALRIPVDWMKSDPAPARVLQVQGGANVTPGAVLGEGSTIRTQPDGYVTLQLADGSLARLQSGSELRLDALKRYPGTEMHRSSMHLLRGRIESLVERLRGGGRSEVTTPVGSAVVRGTRFRVAADEQSRELRSEVLEGAVEVGGSADPARPARVGAGFGTVVSTDGRVADPVALLAAPELSALAPVMDRTLLRFTFPALPGAQRYRALIAIDRDFQRVVAQSVDATPQARFTDIADGEYFVRIRGIDARGLEGRDAAHAFRLKARPEAPFPSQPRNKGKSVGAGAAFAWAENAEASHYRFQLSRDAQFRELLREERAAKGGKLEIASLAPGEYFWRIASVRPSGDQGPFGDAQQFTQRPPPPNPEPPVIGDDTLQFSWQGEAGQIFEFQLARDAAFAQLLEKRELKEPRIELARPGPGEYFMRYRARDPDGFVGPFTAAQKFALPNCITDGSGRCVKSTYDSHLDAR